MDRAVYGSGTPRYYLVREITISQPGYAYIFLSNENLKQVDVYFDDLKITHTHSPIVAGADFYPFGLAMDGREIKDEHYRWGYQGQYAEKDTITGLNEFQLRMYDARFGRWLSADPYGQYHSPYMAMGNIPNMSADPDGGWSWTMAGVGFAVGAGMGYASTGDWEGALLGGIAGGLSGGLSFDENKTLYDEGVRSQNLVLNIKPNQFGYVAGDLLASAGRSYLAQESYSPLKLKDASFYDVAKAFRDAYKRNKSGENFRLTDVFDWSGATYDHGSWGQKQHTRTFTQNQAELFVLFDEETLVDNVQPYYPSVSKINQGVGKGWGVDETKVPTSYKIGLYTIREKYPYTMTIYGQGASNRRLAILSFKDIKQFKSFKDFVRGKPSLKILKK